MLGCVFRSSVLAECLVKHSTGVFRRTAAEVLRRLPGDEPGQAQQVVGGAAEDEDHSEQIQKLLNA